MLRSRLSGKKHSGQPVQPGRLFTPRGGSLYLRRRDGLDRKPGGPPRLATDQTPVPRRGGRLSQADRGQQRGNPVLRDPHRRSRRRLVQVDRRAGRSRKPPRCGQLRAQAVLCQRACEPARMFRTAPGRSLWPADRRAGSRGLEGTSRQGGRAWGDQHGTAGGPRAGLSAGLQRTGPLRLPGAGDGRRDGHGPDGADCRLPPQYHPLLRSRKLWTMHALP